MKRGQAAVVALVCIVSAIPILAWRTLAVEPPAAPAPAATVQRGDYLVNQLAHCGDCHTPRDAKGHLVMAKHLQGAEVWFTPKVKSGEFEDHAPDITASGTAGEWSQDKLVRFFTSGSKGADAPMPDYRLTPDDAQAVAAYLRSLPGSGKHARHGEE
jgi:mono/diheme cytochrome c family protein